MRLEAVFLWLPIPFSFNQNSMSFPAGGCMFETRDLHLLIMQ